MDASIRSALIKRISPYLPEGASVPQSWAELTFTQQLLIEQGDPEAAAVFKGRMNAELEAKVLAGVWSDKPVKPRTEQEIAKEKEEAIQAAFAGLSPMKSADEIEADLKAKRAANEQARMNSLRMVGMG